VTTLVKLLTPDDVAERLGCSRQTAREIVRRHPRCVFIRSLVRLPPDALDEYIAQQSKNRRTPVEPAMQAVLEMPPLLCGIYMLIRDGRIVYVGQSTNIVHRVYAHQREKVFDAVRVIEVPDRKTGKFRWLDTAERLLIEAIAPEINTHAGITAHPVTWREWEQWLGITTARSVEALVRWLVSP